MLFELESDGADVELEPDAELDGEAAFIVGQPKEEASLAGIEDVVEEEGLVADGAVNAGRGPDLFPLLGLHSYG